jgi:hypothetical protein
MNGFPHLPMNATTKPPPAPVERVESILAAMGHARVNLFPAEFEAIAKTLAYADQFGHGNLAAWILTSWAMHLHSQGLDKQTAIDLVSHRTPYPLP